MDNVTFRNHYYTSLDLDFSHDIIRVDISLYYDIKLMLVVL